LRAAHHAADPALAAAFQDRESQRKSWPAMDALRRPSRDLARELDARAGREPFCQLTEA